MPNKEINLTEDTIENKNLINEEKLEKDKNEILEINQKEKDIIIPQEIKQDINLEISNEKENEINLNKSNNALSHEEKKKFRN